jgi:hypothetical protein
VFATAILAAATAACGSSNPAQPSSGSTSAANGLTASVSAPRPVVPANGAQIRNTDQPVVLVVQNAVSTVAGSTYTFEIATDSGFASKVQTKDGVIEGTGGQTGATLDALAAAKDYYWHARATSGGTAGLFGPTYKFTVGSAITISAPTPIAPLTNAQTTSRPTVRVTNAARANTLGPITYRFDLSTTPTFLSIAVTATVAEGVNETGYTSPVDLTYATLYYWRATAIDAASGTSSAPSAVQSFTPVNPLWPNLAPPGTHGHAVRGPGWDPQTLTSFDGHVFSSPPLDESRVFDLLDLGFSPQGALDWMNANGYPTAALYYPNVQAIGFPYTYVALVNGAWVLVLRAGA